MKFFKQFFLVLVLIFWTSCLYASDKDLEQFINDNTKFFQKSSAKTIKPIIDGLRQIESSKLEDFLLSWKQKTLWFRKSDGLIVQATKSNKENYELFAVITKQSLGEFSKKEIKQIKPNSGVRALISSALINFQLSNTDPLIRSATLENLARNPKEKFRELLNEVIKKETDPNLKNQMIRLEKILTIKFEKNIDDRQKAIFALNDDLGIDVRGVLNPILKTYVDVALTVPQEKNIARKIIPGLSKKNKDGSSFTGRPLIRVDPELTKKEAYQMLVEKSLEPPLLTDEILRNILVREVNAGNIDNATVKHLGDIEKRYQLYQKLFEKGDAAHFVLEDQIDDILKNYKFFAYYAEPIEITDVVKITLNKINHKVSMSRFFDLFLDGVSLASIYFLAAIGLAITFGVMRVINMAHGEFIMMGAYTGYVVQSIISNYTLSIILAIPLAFLVTFLAGVVMERLIIRKLYKRPLETLLATFGVSIALQQLAKNVFGTQARPLTSPEWLDGALVLNEIISISWIRVAIFFLSIIFSIALIYILNRTRFGLETRAVTQNPKMAASMGINPDNINMLTFGLGSGIAGVAGVAIGLYAKVTSELGGDYIVQSFMTVVVGGVGSIWGTLAGATLIGFLQKAIEWFNPSNTLAAQTYMIIFIIIFIQFRPRGIIALRGRAAGD